MDLQSGADLAFAPFDAGLAEQHLLVAVRRDLRPDEFRLGVQAEPCDREEGERAGVRLGHKGRTPAQIGAHVAAPVPLVGEGNPSPRGRAGLPVEPQVAPIVVDGAALLGDGVAAPAAPGADREFGGRVLKALGEGPGQVERVGADRLRQARGPDAFSLQRLGAAQVAHRPGGGGICMQEPQFDGAFPVIGQGDGAVAAVAQDPRTHPDAPVPGQGGRLEEIRDVARDPVRADAQPPFGPGCRLPVQRQRGIGDTEQAPLPPAGFALLDEQAPGAQTQRGIHLEAPRPGLPAQRGRDRQIAGPGAQAALGGEVRRLYRSVQPVIVEAGPQRQLQGSEAPVPGGPRRLDGREMVAAAALPSLVAGPGERVGSRGDGRPAGLVAEGDAALSDPLPPVDPVLQADQPGAGLLAELRDIAPGIQGVRDEIGRGPERLVHVAVVGVEPVFQAQGRDVQGT